MIALLIMLLMLWALFVSSIPLVLVPYFAAWIWRGHLHSQWMPASLVGNVELTFAGVFEQEGQREIFIRYIRFMLRCLSAYKGRQALVYLA